MDAQPTYVYRDGTASPSDEYLLPAVRKVLARSASRRVFDLGCGNGTVAGALAADGYSVVGVDAAPTGIAFARQKFPAVRFEEGNAYDDLAARYGTFPAVVSLEVVEHLYSPEVYARTVFDLLEPGGVAIISTPYHGYWKNLAIAASGRMDRHHDPLWIGGHIKFWSIRTLTELLARAGLERVEFIRVGRVPALAKSMIGVFRRPAR